ncbi:MAG TPA: aryl-sulfate sulfotransferase, partial [Candidatus Eisenbacteria bacterium]|nr:aryl-sulfate sulfotransferase [Candidatus Eisenbacteria bacterium]
LSDDGQTIVFHPDAPFVAGEEVSCSIAPGIRTDIGGILGGATFDFFVAPAPAAPSPAPAALLEDEAPAVNLFVPRDPARAAAMRSDSLPMAGVVVSGSPSEGRVFLCDIRFDASTYRSHLMILGNDGAPLATRDLIGAGYDFKVQPNGKVTCFDADSRHHLVLNAKLAVVDSLQCGNGYTTDVHELQLLPNGHALLLAYDPQTIDMSAVVSGGNAQARVLGLIVQELDRARDVVFQWRSWDHFQITDCASRPLTGANVDYVHGNSIERDADGNLLISSRHLDEITKISRSTGAILWRLGGTNNEFTFTNDPERFSQQHSARRLSNGHLLLFDNGNYHTPARSRAVEYTLDEAAKTATKVWEYRNAPDVYATAMGSVQRLPDGHTVIGWGTASPALTEVTAEGAEVFELTLPAGIYSYRAFRFDWPPTLAAGVAIRSGSVLRAAHGGQVAVLVTGEDFAPDSLDPATVRLQGVAASGYTPPSAPGGAAELLFPVDLLLASQTPGVRQLELTGSLVSGERIRGAARVTIEGTRTIGARMVSPVGAVPIRIALRSDGVNPRRVRLAAYDVRGRRVCRWTAEADPAGIAAWDGRRPDGAPLASGIYFLRTEGSALTETAKVIIAR